MKLTKMPKEFQEALPILNKLKSSGYDAYFVGGSVRDVLLDRKIHDVDIASSAYPEEVKHIFEKTVDIGIEHGTVLVLEEEGQYEVTTFRTEDVYVDYRRPSGVTFVRSLSEDLLRRDFTINAFALAEDGEIIDKFSGLADLDNKLIKAVGVADDRFNEDALRIMRALRFTASLDFDIEELTFEAMKEHAHLLEKISIERIFIELDKLLLADFWRKGLKNLIDTEVYNYLPDFVAKKNELINILNKLTNPEFIFTSSAQAWAYLLLNLKIDECKPCLRKWNVSNDFIKEVTSISEAYEIRTKRDWTRQDLYEYGSQVLREVEELKNAEGFSVDFKKIDYLEASLPIHSKADLAVNGASLMETFSRPGGIWIGQIINQIESLVVTGELKNDQATIIEYVKGILND
jgi:tRNA nucleotidyltransferase/poly(A) polymerase